MQIRPVIFLKQLNQASGQALARLSELGWPLFMDAMEVQTTGDPAQILGKFSKNEVHMWSAEVEDFKSPLGGCIKKACDEEWTHVVHLQNYSPEILTELENIHQKITKDPFDLFFFTGKKQETKSGALNRLLDLGEKDYREFNTGNFICPTFYLQNYSLKTQSSSELHSLLAHQLHEKRNIQDLPLPIELKTPESNFWKKQFYDWWLLALSSLHNNTNPIKGALSFSMGAFLACTPFYGMQTFLIVVSSFVFRLNFAIAFLGSQISIPPIYSLIVPLQLYVGFKMTGTPFSFEGDLIDVAKEHFYAWFIGSMIVGGVLSFAMGLMWYWAQKKSQTPQVNWSGKMRGGRFGNWLLISLMRAMGLKVGYFLLYFIIPYFYFFAPRARRGLNQYYKIMSPKLSWTNRQFKIVAHLYKFAQVLMDQAFQAHHEDLSFEIEYLTGNALREVNNPGAHVMLFSHFGGWAIATQGFSRRNSSKPISLIRYKNKALDSEKVFQEKNNQKLKPIDINPGEPIFMAIHEVLREGGDLAIMGDRPFDNNFELKSFLGKLAPIPTTPFRLAKTYKARISFVFGFRRGFCAYGLATETLEMADHTVEEAMEEYLKFFTKYIREYPDQWFNLFNYWSALPTLPNGMECIPVKNSFGVNPAGGSKENKKIDVNI